MAGLAHMFIQYKTNTFYSPKGYTYTVWGYTINKRNKWSIKNYNLHNTDEIVGENHHVIYINTNFSYHVFTKHFI